MMKLASVLVSALALAATPLAFAKKLPNADTPLFYLVTSSNSWTNLLPVRMSSGGDATLLGGGKPVQFYFWQGYLTVNDPFVGNMRPYVNSNQDGSGCPNFGAFGFVHGTSTNKCTKYGTFQIQVGEDAQLGSQLVFNYQGGFYSCNGGQTIYYKDTPSRPPNNCEPISLWTVPVA